MSGYGRTVHVHASVRITSGHENWPTSADHSSAPAIYASETEAVQPPDDRTYSAEVTAARRNLLHHRIGVCAVSPHNLRYDTIFKAICQVLFQKFLQILLRIFGHSDKKFRLSEKEAFRCALLFTCPCRIGLPIYK